MPVTNTKRVNWKRVGLCLAIIFAAGYVVDGLAMHGMVWYAARGAAGDPRASIMPRRLANTGLADLKGGNDVLDFGYLVSLPGKVSHRDDLNTLSVIKLDNGIEIDLDDIRDPPPGIALTKGRTPEYAGDVRSVYGDLAKGSRYDWMRAELNASPADVFFWRSKANNAKALALISLKTGMIGKAKVIYPVTAGKMHGFQIGDPQQAVSSVGLWLFDSNDREIWMILHRAPNGIGFSQEQINAIVASIRPAQ